MKQILILGAGMSGLCAARKLQRAGYGVCLVDKGRGIGGRMATRRFEGGTFDHGAQFFTTRSDEFKTLLREWEHNEVAGEWFRGYPSPEDKKPDDEHPRFRGSSGMTGIGKYMAEGLEVELGEEIVSLSFEDGCWCATSKSGSHFEADELILTAPVPQSLALLDAAGVALPTATRETLEALRYEPCFAVLAKLEGPSKIPPPGALYLESDILAWVADNFQKGISEQEGSVTIHSTGDWAKAHFDDNKDEVATKLLEAAAPLLCSKVVGYQVHRWRYSKPENPLEIGHLRVAELNLTFAGDIFQGAKIEGAALSGLSAARAIIAD
ncbi:FAD-dependent oxidoreductase [bacterium]|nr:MAG: FAD-dependent oxidoreductase [bacterium]